MFKKSPKGRRTREKNSIIKIKYFIIASEKNAKKKAKATEKKLATARRNPKNIAVGTKMVISELEIIAATENPLNVFMAMGSTVA